MGTWNALTTRLKKVLGMMAETLFTKGKGNIRILAASLCALPPPPMMYLSYYYKKPAKASICLLRAFSSRAGTFIHAANFFISNLRMHIFRLRICISNLRMCISSLKIKNLCGKAGFVSRMNTICRPHEIKVKFRQAPCFFAFSRLILCRQFC